MIIVAYKRKYLEIGAEKRGGKDEQKIENRLYTHRGITLNPPLPTAWSCRFSSSVKKGLHEEGLVESKTD